MNNSKFSENEIVILHPIDAKAVNAKRRYERSLVNNTKGIVRGVSQNDNGEWYYAVLLDMYEEVWCFYEDELESTGNFAEPMKPAGFVKVLVYEKGEGKIKDD